ncbi:hypothetical protein DXG01_011324 [Tephrocybe rancida]|nr:hypothetical protein DXG01_011324 [Tephrocybe rancida]
MRFANHLHADESGAAEGRSILKLSERELERLLCGGKDDLKSAFPLLRSFTYDYFRHELFQTFQVNLPEEIWQEILLQLVILPSLAHLNLKFHPDCHPHDDALPSTLPFSLSTLEVSGGPDQLVDLLETLQSAQIDKLHVAHYDSMWRRNPRDDYKNLFKALNEAGKGAHEVVVEIYNEYPWDFEEDTEVVSWKWLFPCLADLKGPNLTAFKCCPPFLITFPSSTPWYSLAQQWSNLKILHIGRHEFFPSDSSIAVALPAAVDLALLLPHLVELRIPFTAPEPFHPQASLSANSVTSFGYACGQLGEDRAAAVVNYLWEVFPHLKSFILGSEDDDDEDDGHVNNWQAVRDVFV